MNMKLCLSYICVFSFCFLISETAKLPTYLTQCSQSDPKINECFKRNANLGIKQIVKGDIYYDIPCMKPLRYPHPMIRKDSDFTMSLTNVEIHGLESTKVTDVDLNVAKGTFKLDLSIPSIVAIGEYTVNGNLYSIPLWRNGHFNRKLDGIKIQYSNSFVSSDVDGEQFFNIISAKANYETDNEIYDFQGLFNEYHYFGHSLKSSLNLRVQQISEEMKSTINKQIAEFITSIFEGILSKVPRSDFFKP